MVTIREVRQPSTRPHLAADQFERIGILLLRHQAGPAGDAVAQFQPAELLAGVEDPVLGQAAQVDHGHAGGVEEIEREIAVAGDVHAVGGDGGEAQIARDGLRDRRESRCRPARRNRAAGRRRGGALRRSAPNRARTFRNRPAGSAARARPARGACGCSRG